MQRNDTIRGSLGWIAARLRAWLAAAGTALDFRRALRSTASVGVLFWVHGSLMNARADHGFCGDICPSRSFSVAGAKIGVPFPVAGLGSNYFVAGVPEYVSNSVVRGAVLIYSTNSLLGTLVNPVAIGGFGTGLAALDSARFAVGAPSNTFGRVYLYAFSTNTGTATLLATVNNPSNQLCQFGASIAPVGSQWFLAGAPHFNVGTNNSAGVAYLFHTNGSLALTITNPTPARLELFGGAVAGVGPDRFVLGAPAASIGTATNGGIVYLYSTNGTLLRVIDNPNPRRGDLFGTSVADVGLDWFAVGAMGVDHVSATATNLDSGAVYLYNSSGTQLRVIRHPFPGPVGLAAEYFGRSVSRLGQDRLLVVAAFDAFDLVQNSRGALYIYDLNSAGLLATVTNPDPLPFYHEFAAGVAALGSDRFVLTGNPPLGLPGSGSVYYYDAGVAQYALGQQIPPPPNLPLADLVESGPEIDPPGAAFWHRPNPFQARLFATKAGQLTIRWKTVNNDVVTVRALNVWPPNGNDYQLHVVNTPPVDLSEGGYYKWAGLMDHEPATGADESEVQVSRHFSAQGPGRSFLMLSPGNPLQDAIHFQLVRTVTWDDLNYLHDYDPFAPGQQDVPFNIGDEILDLTFHNPACGAPFVFWENSFYNADPGYYDRAQRTGPIFAVNRDQPPITDDMLVIYYQKSTTLKDAVTGAPVSRSIAWPWKPVRYECDWPSNATQIVIADFANRPALDEETYAAWNLYVQDDPGKPGFNPNDEHALKLPYADGKAIFPLRDDLGTPTTSEPYVLIKYYDGTDGFKPKMKVFRVVAGTFNYPILAAQLVQPPFPLTLFQKAPESSAVSGPYFRDRKLDFWAKAAGNNGGTADIVMRFFYPIQAGFYFPSNYFVHFPSRVPKTNLPPAGTRFPWLDLRAATPKVPHDINYTVSWPSAPELSVGETLVNPKKGLPDISSQTSVEVIYQQAQALDSNKTSVVLIDPTRERTVTLSALPGSVETIQRGNKHFFPKLPPHLRERLFFDDTEDKLNLKGQFVDPPLGESYLLLNVLTAREKQLVNSLYPSLAGPVNSLPSSLIEIDPGTTAFDSLALTAGNAEGEGYVTLAFGNNAVLSPPAEPVSLVVIRVVCPPYLGEIKVVESDNPFDEKLTMRHSGDFAGKADRYQFQWKYARPGPDGSPPTREQVITNGFLFAPNPSSGSGAIDITIEGPGLLTLADNYFICRYRATSPLTAPCGTNWNDWTQVMLGEGWIKRVLSGINPFEPRFKSYQNNQINTVVSMISQAGSRYEGDVPLSLSAADQFGLIEIYETVLRRGIMLSIGFGIDEPAANNAILLAAGRLADLYLLLGNEAYADAADPTIGFGTDDGIYGSEATSIHSFMNQTASLLEEELVLLRGRDESKLPSVRTVPIYNRLAWNFTRDINGGEVAYALNYNIRDENGNVDGVIDEADAKKLYPQGHGDAWGHYLTAIKYYYRLVTHTNFTWIPRTEAILLGGAPVEVDYLDERKFARAAASKARTGAEIVNLSYRNSYFEAPDTDAPDYSDADPARAWGMADWASRAGQGALIDWVVANAMLPESSTNSGIKKVDRTTVTELSEIPAALDEIQSKIDMADAGLNPLGLARNAVPFDISPAEIEEGNTHFEQIFGRAVLAMNNAITVFNHAHNSTQLLRRQADDLADFQIAVQEREFDFKNRLIELFGYPYSNDIGPAGTYPAGYDGPDIYHFDYYDPTELVGFKPAAVQTLTGNFRELDVDDETGELTEVLRKVEFHISTEGFGLIKPSAWRGKRRAPGEIQFARSELIQTKARFEKALLEYDNLIAQIEDQAQALEVQHAVNAGEIQVLNESRQTGTKLNEMIKSSRESQLGDRRTARIATLFFDAIAEALPIVAGLANDVTSVARGALKLIGSIQAEIFTGYADSESINEQELANLKEDNQALTNIKLTTTNQLLPITQQVAQLEQSVRQTIPLRLEILTLRETLGQAAGRYAGSLARGQRLLEDRLRFRQQTAAQIQVYRYKDMAFRIFRNDAIQKYRAQFDLAAMYVYLAGKAYDFEACLPEDDIFGAPFFLTDIIRTRSLGLIANGQPMIASGWGDPGLADPLAWMNLYWNLVLDGSFENPQTETGRFSLRSELFRILPGEQGNANWRETLNRHVVPHFPDLPEVKRYCVLPYPLQSSEPAIVIPFSTTINFGLNYFGWPLGGGDNAYNSTYSATKIRSAGVWFANYNNIVGGGLANTPQVYVIPVGADLMRTSPDAFGVRRSREWKVFDQKLPKPFQFNTRVLEDNLAWISFTDTMVEELADLRQFQSFRAYHDSGMFDPEETISNSRLIGRSVWNDRWLLIIPAGALYSDRQEALLRFIHGPLVNGQRTGQGVSDIKIFFQTYSY
jgi:hypothetical protein